MLLSRKDVDPKRIALQGISQGGYWVPRALAFEKRIAAGIADPGVVDVSTSWTKSIPTPLVELLKAGRKQEFDSNLARGTSSADRGYLDFRVRPFGFTSYYDTYHAVQGYNLRGVADKISCPMLITGPANEAYWPGQSEELYDLLTGPKEAGAIFRGRWSGSALRGQRNRPPRPARSSTGWTRHFDELFGYSSEGVETFVRWRSIWSDLQTPQKTPREVLQPNS